MTSLRVLLRRHRALAAAVLTAAMLLRLLVPAGFMPAASGSGVALVICSGAAPAATAAHASMHHGSKDASEHEGTQHRCAFADLALPLVGGAAPALLVAALLVAIAAALFFRAAPARARGGQLRPPLRGPPVAA